MNTDRDLNYRLYVQKTDGFTRPSFRSELEKYIVIQSGDVESARRNFRNVRKNFLEGKGLLSDNPIRNIRYHLIISAALTARICVEGGMSHDTAYTLSDIYIQKADKCESYEELLDLFETMQVDFAGRMNEMKKNNVISIHVRKSIDYIYEHLHEKIKVSELAEFTGLNESYLSKLFSKETGRSITDFIANAKVSTAENMLKYSDFSSLEISLALGYSSQSAFIGSFRKITGVTPKKYREANFNGSFIRLGEADMP